MANPTTNFGWVMPTATDLVTDLPADFNVFGQAVDTSMAGLKGGTTGQILSKTSATDMAFTWITNDVGDITAVTAGTGISGGGTSGAVTVTNSMATAITTAGDVIYGTGSGTFTRLGIGTAGQVLKVNAGATAPEWGAAAAGALTYIGGATFSATSSQSLNSVFSSTYTNYLILCNIDSVSTGANINLRMRASGTDSSASYYSNILYNDLTAGTTTFGNVSVSNGSSWKIGDLNTSGQPFGFTCTMFNPFRTVTTTFESGSHGYNYNGTVYQSFTGGYHGVGGTSYDGISIFPTSGTFTGSIRVYGYANS
jgi:hypothetical protein